MDHSSFIHGLIVSVYLAVLTVCLVLFLVRRKIPRRALLEIVELSVLVFAAAAVISYQIGDRVVFDGGDSFLIYVPPVIPTAAVAVWLTRRVERQMKMFSNTAPGSIAAIPPVSSAPSNTKPGNNSVPASGGGGSAWDQ